MGVDYGRIGEKTAVFRGIFKAVRT